MYDSQELSESTLLTSGIPKPRYAFESSLSRIRRRRVRQFQCCVCTIFLFIITVSIVISVAYNINKENMEAANNSVDDSNNTFIFLTRVIPLNYVALGPVKNISASDYQSAVNFGKDALNQREIIEKYTPELDVTSPSFKHQKLVATSSKGQAIGKIGYAEEYGSRLLNKTFHLEQPLCFNGTVDALFQPICNMTDEPCNNTKYRSYDGRCNNLKLIYSGVSYRPFRRILNPQYGDGISSPRLSSDGTPLPSARTVSRVVHRPIYKDDPDFTVMLAVFGQFLDHDITATALSQGANGQTIACCNADPSNMHPECFPVYIDEADPYRKEFNVTCMEFVRSLPAPTCCFGPRQQLNQATSFIDASVVYGDPDVVKTLRTFTDGLLKMFVSPDNRTLLPKSENPNDGCNRDAEAAKGRYCFSTGDGRANENLHLTSLHLIWARHHNTLAGQLKKLNPQWDDEKMFQESRKILSAQMQHITYNEFLPILFNLEIMDSFELSPMEDGYYDGYDKSTDVSAANGFAASAFRFAHTLIPSLIKMIGSDRENKDNVDYIELHKMLLDPFRLYDAGYMDKALRGAMHTNIQANDVYFSKELKHHMFQGPSTGVENDGEKLCGLDLVSLNIQRGRDHGLPGYTRWREHCGQSRPRSFDQLAGHIDDDSLAQLRTIYRHVDDIDFYTGALSEKPLKDSFLGPTITCMLLDQFVRLKKGDRFWYENSEQFTLKQLREIRNTSLARIICDNSDNVEYVQREVMKKINETTNPMVKCNDLPSTDLKFWQEFPNIPLAKDGLDVGGN